MSAPVDVLAVLRRGEWDIENVVEAGQAIAAVAELVSKGRGLSDYLDAYLAWQREQGGDQFGADIAEHDIEQFRAALAKFGGAA